MSAGTLPRSHVVTVSVSDDDGSVVGTWEVCGNMDLVQLMQIAVVRAAQALRTIGYGGDRPGDFVPEEWEEA